MQPKNDELAIPQTNITVSTETNFTRNEKIKLQTI